MGQSCPTPTLPSTLSPFFLTLPNPSGPLIFIPILPSLSPHLCPRYLPIPTLSQSFDSKEELKGKVEALAQLIRESQYLVVHSGAGISTSSGIPDFR
jgi:hypothetical protein